MGNTAFEAEDRTFIENVIQAYGIREDGVLKPGFTKFLEVMRREYEVVK